MTGLLVTLCSLILDPLCARQKLNTVLLDRCMARRTLEAMLSVGDCRPVLGRWLLRGRVVS